MVSSPVAGLNVPEPAGRIVTELKVPLPGLEELNSLNTVPPARTLLPTLVTTSEPAYVTPVRPATRSLLVVPPLRLISTEVVLPFERVNVLLIVSVPMEAPGESVAPEATFTGPAMVPVPPRAPALTRVVPV